MLDDFARPSLATIQSDNFMATATALAIAGMAASTGAQVYGAKKASDASKDAAKLQTAAADEAQRRLDVSHKASDDVYAPYLSAGRSATSTLGRLVTPGPGARYASPGPAQPAPAPAPTDRAVPRQVPMGRGARGGLGGGAGAPNEGMAPPRTFGSMVPRGGGNVVMIEAPDGSGVRPVPADQAQRFLDAGGRQVG